MIIIYCILIPVLVSVILSVVVLPRIIFVSYKKKLFDIPNARKVHDTPIPRLGGFSFYPILTFTITLTTAIRYLHGEPITGIDLLQTFMQFIFLMAGGTLLYLMGLYDDLVGVRYYKKFIIQIISACFFPLAGLWINNFGGLFGIYEISPSIGMPFTVILVVFITNAINLIDGIDGLASGLSSISLFVITLLCFHYKHYIYASLALSLLSILAVFFVYNVYGRAENLHKIFMGDTGSLTIGYVISFLAIHLCINTPTFISRGNLMIVFSTLLIPCFDVIRVMYDRIVTHHNPFKPDKNHIHHKLLRTGMHVRWVMATLLFVSIFFIALNYWWERCSGISLTILLFVDIALWFLMNQIINYFIRRHAEKNGLYQ